MTGKRLTSALILITFSSGLLYTAAENIKVEFVKSKVHFHSDMIEEKTRISAGNSLGQNGRLETGRNSEILVLFSGDLRMYMPSDSAVSYKTGTDTVLIIPETGSFALLNDRKSGKKAEVLLPSHILSMTEGELSVFGNPSILAVYQGTVYVVEKTSGFETYVGKGQFTTLFSGRQPAISLHLDRLTQPNPNHNRIIQIFKMLNILRRQKDN